MTLLTTMSSRSSLLRSYFLRTARLSQNATLGRNCGIFTRTLADQNFTPDHQQPTSDRRSIFPPSRHSFSSSARSDLSDLLARELAEEESNTDSENLPPELATLQQELEKDWRIVDNADNGTVQLHHKSNNKGVCISFHCQDTLDMDEDNEEQVDEEEPAVAIRFLLTVTKAGKTMVLTCLSDMAVVSIERVSVTTQDDTTKIQQNSGIEEELYQGPEFTELNQHVQDAFHSFVADSCGVTSDVAAFINMFADWKEQQEYMKWIKQVQSLIGE